MIVGTTISRCPFSFTNGIRVLPGRAHSTSSSGTSRSTGEMLGAGDPVRVRAGQRVLFRILNASATLTHRLALPGHLFRVLALDGYPVPNPRSVPILAVAPGERIDAVVEMGHPGDWIFGEVDAVQRAAGMGVVVEYAGAAGAPQWRPVAATPWDYLIFGGDTPAPAPDARSTLVFRATNDGHHWTINGRSHPRTDDIVVQANRRYRWLLDNQSAHPYVSTAMRSRWSGMPARPPRAFGKM